VVVISLLVTALGALASVATIIGLYYAIATYKQGKPAEPRAEDKSGRAVATKPRPSGAKARSRWVRFNALLSLAAVCVLAVGIFLITRTGPQPPRVAGGWSVQWGPGKLVLQDSSWTDLDAIPPRVDGGLSNTMVLEGNEYEDGYGIATWTRKDTPSAASCNSLLMSTSGNGVLIKRGQIDCAKTAEGHIAIIVVERLETAYAGGPVTAVNRVTIWARDY
jgi:hypothetical protein